MDLEMLNRLRVNAGKTPLKSWKASKEKLTEAIKTLQDAGHTDALPGADLNAKPNSPDPELIKARQDPEEEKPKEEETQGEPVNPSPPVTQVKAQLGKGLENEPMARQSRIAVARQREAEQAEAKAAKKEAKRLAKEEKKAAKKAGKKNGKKVLAKGEVDPQKEPAKAKRQKEHIEAKRKAREGKPPKKTHGDDEISVAEIARDLGIDPKVARAKLRRHEDKLTKLHTKGQDKWIFPKTAKAEISKILK